MKKKEIENQNLEKILLKKMILDNPNQPKRYTFSALYRFFNYETYSEEEIKEVLNKLISKNIILEKNNIYSLNRNDFFRLKNKYKFHILLNSDFNKLVFPLIIGIIASVLSMFPKITNLLTDKNQDIEIQNKLDFEIRELEKKINRAYIIPQKKYNKSDTIKIEILKIQKQYSELSENVNSLNSLLQDNPRKFVEIAAMKRDIEDLKREIKSNDESIKREVDRISSYNNTLIAFMITFLVAYIGLGIFNFVKKNDNSTI
ncbi:DUF5457 domain-containing protein [Flavobacterium sp. GN10]|uniref:DUF5457 domain-containing protein n=1 Tax=Flavobacterium tagetis TaxID=2801336 RepID=A0ABS1KGB5_9FLAO|nr:DUF5457 domain-containing protein [Flavobacterium tagetis]MBL0738364.1 DUF5457 domain-containing protein [Flavobacterium tagetis]